MTLFLSLYCSGWRQYSSISLSLPFTKLKHMAEPSIESPLRTRPNYFYAILSVALVLFLLGLFGMIAIQANQLIRVFKERINVLIELQEGTDTETISNLQARLEKSRFTKAGTVTFISREAAARDMAETFGEDFLKLDLPNPFYDIITFNLRAEYVQTDSLQRIRAGIMRDPYVTGVYYQENLVEEIGGNINRIGLISLVAGLFFIVVAVTLIHNTIRLALYANRFIIRNMELVGASWDFISRPYLLRSLRHGLLSATIAIGVLILLLSWAQSRLPELKQIEDLTGLVLLFAALIILGVFINMASTYYVVRKYLRMREDDLY